MQQAMLRGKFTALNPYGRREERFKINNLSFYLWKIENIEQFKHIASRRNK